MEKKKFYFASKIIDELELIEPWVQYDTEGQIDHTIYISKNKILVYGVTDDYGNTAFYLYPSGEMVTESNEEFSYSTEAFCGWTIYYPDTIKESKVGYFIPIEEYFGLSNEVTSPVLANILLRLANLGKRGNIQLSTNREEAKEQILKLKR